MVIYLYNGIDLGNRDFVDPIEIGGSEIPDKI